ncbi:MAG: type II CRISPR-associated endonuclease Cas1 [Planctomycetaceae bacterium]|jgi:CRISPR-associated protein Cas1|nr:type II CRISPR-associated endonuclease Cas1 [Planctomycetaceae bacterium]
MRFLRRISSYFNREEQPASIAAAHANRILDFSEERCKLRVENRQLVVEKADGAVTAIPFAEIAVIIISNNGVSLTQSVLQTVAECAGMLVICDYKHLPVSMMLPMQPCSIPVERLKLQIEASLPTVKSAWQQVVKAKIQAQGHLLTECFGNDAGLMKIAESVKSGDPDNREAYAAKSYWKALFPEIDFHRNPDSDDPINIRLNYGYTILRSMTARAICATGFHPALGIHHCHQRDAFCLADDLMEPFRPLVDKTVRILFKASRTLKSIQMTKTLDPKTKERMIFPLTKRFIANGEKRKLFDIITLLAQSLVKYYGKETTELYLPEIEWIDNNEEETRDIPG